MLMFSCCNIEESWQKCHFAISKICRYSRIYLEGVWDLAECKLTLPNYWQQSGEIRDYSAVPVRWWMTACCMWHTRNESMKDGSTGGEIKSSWKKSHSDWLFVSKPTQYKWPSTMLYTTTVSGKYFGGRVREAGKLYRTTHLKQLYGTTQVVCWLHGTCRSLNMLTPEATRFGIKENVTVWLSSILFPMMFP